MTPATTTSATDSASTEGATAATSTTSKGSSGAPTDTGAASDTTASSESSTAATPTTSGTGEGECQAALDFITQSVAVSGNSDAIDTADLNADGLADLINVSRTDGTVQALLGNGVGGFTPGGVFHLDGSGFPDLVRVVAIADDVPDLLVHMEGPVELWAIRGDGTGNWPSSPDIYTSTYARGLDIGDLNNDGVADIAYTGISELEVRFGNALERFSPPTLFGTNYGRIVRIADVNTDGNLDILTSDLFSSELQIYQGSGSGTFSLLPTLVLGSEVVGVDAGDITGDGLTDVVVSAESDIRVYPGTGSGISSAPAIVLAAEVGAGRVADLDGDGDADVVARGSCGKDCFTIEVFRSDEDELTPTASAICDAYVRDFVVANFNSDCVLDIAAAQGEGGEICMVLSAD